MEEKNSFLERLDQILDDLQLFILNSIFRNEPLPFADYQLEIANVPTLEQALEKFSIGAFTPFENNLVPQLENERDSITMTEFLVKNF